MTGTKPRRWPWWAASLVLLVALPVGLTVWYRCRDRIPEVPLGVEHAVAMTCKGPELVIKPYRRGVDVNLRLERVIRKGDTRVYDFRYMINRPGLVDISAYLTSADGQTPPALPSFRVRGVARLSQEVEKRILETEDIGIDIPHGYYAFMGTAVFLWVAGLLLLVFWRPRRKAAVPVAVPVPLTALLGELLDRLRAGTLDAAGRARMENVMFHSWQARRVPAEPDMRMVLRQVENSGSDGAAYRMLEDWLHNPAAKTSDTEMLKALAPYGVPPVTGKEP